MTAEKLDFDPPDALLDQLEHRTGVSAHRLRWMTLSGSYDPVTVSEIASTPVYLRGQPDTKLDAFAVRGALAASDRFRKPWACEACLRHNPGHIQLHWKLPWTATCPKHCDFLRPLDYVGQTGLHLWKPYRPKLLSLHLQIDTLTVSALQGGKCYFNGYAMDGIEWLGMLQRLLIELNTSARDAGDEAASLRKLWDLCNLKPRAGAPLDWTFEELCQELQVNFLSAAAVAMDLIAKRKGKRIARFHDCGRVAAAR